MACIPVYKGRRFNSTEELEAFLKTPQAIMQHLASGDDVDFVREFEQALEIAEQGAPFPSETKALEQPIVKQPAAPLTTGEGKEGESPIQSFDAAQSLKGEEGRNARKALKESMGKEQYKDLEAITNKFPQIAKDLESRGVWKIDCP